MKKFDLTLQLINEKNEPATRDIMRVEGNQYVKEKTENLTTGVIIRESVSNARQQKEGTPKNLADQAEMGNIALKIIRGVKSMDFKAETITKIKEKIAEFGWPTYICAQMEYYFEVGAGKSVLEPLEIEDTE